MESVVQTNLGALAVRTEGAGPVAVLWHSLFVDDRSWDRVAAALATERRLVRITGPGHGASAPVTRRYTLEDCAAAALEVLDALGIAGPVDWVGTAWGGHVGIVLAAAHPERVRTLAAFNTPVQALRGRAAIPPAILSAVFRVVGPVGPVLSGVTSALLGERTQMEDPDAVAYVHDCLRAADRHALVAAVRSVSLGRPDLSPLLPRVSAPTLLVTGPDDPMWTEAQAAAAAAAMPNARVEVVADSHHLTPLEAPADSAALLTSLWGQAAR